MARREYMSIGQLEVDNITGAGAPIVASSGQKFWVDDSPLTGSPISGMNYLTIRDANTQCVASRGDVIYVAAGHAETLSTALALKAGVTVIGLGNGTNRPAITITVAGPGFNCTGANAKIYNLRIIAGSTATAASTNLSRIAASGVKFYSCEFSTAYKLYHQNRIVSGDDSGYEDCTYLNTYAPGAGAAGIKAQCCILNIGGTNARVTGCRFNDIAADKAHRWKAVVEGGKLTASLTVEKCFFLCRGIATRTRSAAASGYMATVDCRAISPSSNTGTGALYTPTYQYVIESYDVAAVNKVGVVSVTTSDIRVKTSVVYL